MGRFWGLFGILCIIGSIGFMVSTVFDAKNPIIVGGLETFACTENETLRVEQSSWSLPNGERGINTSYFCDIEPNVGRNVTEMSIVIQVIVFTALLGLGIISIIAAAARATNATADRLQDQLQQQFAEGGDGTYVSIQGNLQNVPPQTRDMIENILDGVMTNAMVNNSGIQSASLSERLQQLDEAYQKNLINKDEYDRVRQAILESMDD